MCAPTLSGFILGIVTAIDNGGASGLELVEGHVGAHSRGWREAVRLLLTCAAVRDDLHRELRDEVLKGSGRNGT